MTPRHARLRAFLTGADLPVSTLLRDPEGRTWLPDDLRELVVSCPRAAAMLRRFVEAEILLYDAVPVADDPGFVARVMADADAVARADGCAALRATVLLVAHFAAVVALVGLGASFVHDGWDLLEGMMASAAAAMAEVADPALWASSSWGMAMLLLPLGLAGWLVSTAARRRVARAGRALHTSG